MATVSATPARRVGLDDRGRDRAGPACRSRAGPRPGRRGGGARGVVPRGARRMIRRERGRGGGQARLDVAARLARVGGGIALEHWSRAQISWKADDSMVTDADLADPDLPRRGDRRRVPGRRRARRGERRVGAAPARGAARLGRGPDRRDEQLRAGPARLLDLGRRAPLRAAPLRRGLRSAHRPALHRARGAGSLAQRAAAARDRRRRGRRAHSSACARPTATGCRPSSRAGSPGTGCGGWARPRCTSATSRPGRSPSCTISGRRSGTSRARRRCCSRRAAS